MKTVGKYIFYCILFSCLIYWSTGVKWNDIHYWTGAIGGLGMYLTGYYQARELEDDYSGE